MKLAEFSIKHSLFVNLLSLFLLLAGVFSLLRMQREAYPSVSFDVVTVNTVYAGAPAEEVEKLATIPLEKELKRVDGIDEIRSSSLENLSAISIMLSPEVKNKAKVINDIQRAVDRVKNFPEGVEDPEVTEISMKEFPVIEVSLSGQLLEANLQEYAEALQDRLEDIKGVASVNRKGFRDEEIWIEVEPEKLKEYHLSLEEIMSALRRRNRSIPAGKLTLPQGEFSIRTTGEFKTVPEIEEVIIRANEVGNYLRVRDVGQVKRTFEEEDVINKTLGTRAINLVVVKKESGDAIDIVEDIKCIVEDFRKDVSPELKISYVDDLSFYIQRRLDVLRNNGWIGVSLVIISLLIFLNRYVAVITAFGLPIAFFTTFAVMSYLGISINLISMFGLIIVLGMLVDDGIIISENVYRYIEGGMAPREAAIVGTQEVMRPVTATILTTMAAFSPLLFMSGIIGKFIRGIPIVVILALAASLLEAFVILPSHLSDFVRVRRDKSGRVRSKKESPWFQKLLSGYTGLLRGAVKRRYLVVVCLFILLISFVFIAKNMSFILFPSTGIEFFFVRAEAPRGTPLEKTNELVKQLEVLVRELSPEELDTFVTEVGRFQENILDPYLRRDSHLTQITVYLTPPRQRKRDAFEIKEALRERAKNIEGFENIYFDMPEGGPPVGKAVAVRIRGEEYNVLEEIANQFQDFMKPVEGALDVQHDYRPGEDQIRVIVDEAKASRAYLSIGEIAATVRNAFEGGVATSIKRVKAEEEIDVIVRFPLAERKTLETFQEILIPNRFDNLIPLKEVGRVEEGKGMTVINHLDGKRVVTVSAGVDTEKITSLKLNQMVAKHFKDIESRYPGYTVRYGGEQEETQESMRSLLRAFVLAFFLIFMILATNFNSLHQPLVVMLAIPFGLIGVIIAFLLHGEPLSFMAFLGVVGLSGVVVNDSIVLVDFINKLRKKGVDRRHSIIEAGQLRLRPVTLTTLTTVLGLTPVAYGIGGGDPFLQPAALAICWGLVFATALTLIVIPCIYAVIDDLAIFLSRGRKKKREFKEEEL
ncbi:efflux RND transporter permease subunit [bacterium]|nr:efflux RND transporter permease subunit [bacterium]